MGEDTIRCRRLEPGESWVVQEVFAGLSDRARHRRFHGRLTRLTPSVLAALTAVDGERHLAVVAEVNEHGVWRPIGLARLVRGEASEAELAIEVVDAWQGRGVGRRLLEEVCRRGAAVGITTVTASVLVGNRPMLDLLLRTFPLARIVSDGHTWEVRAGLDGLTGGSRARPGTRSGPRFGRWLAGRWVRAA
jgi:GNAT superfamily N-acetyltransferase